MLIIFGFGILGSVFVNLFKTEPEDLYIHIRSFRYGKHPDIIRCNRGDRLHLTFSTDDTGHSFFLSEFNIDVKVNPGTSEVAVFKADHPEEKPEIKTEVLLVAEHPGILKYLVAKSQYRCHVWCGLLHGFEQGSLIIYPNTLLGFGVGTLSGILFLLLISGIFNRKQEPDLNAINPVKFSEQWNKFFISPSAKLTLKLLCLAFIYIVIIISILGTRVAGRNLGTIVVWIVWLFLLVTILTPLFGRIWCYICPIPFFGDLFQRGSITNVTGGKTGKYNNRFFGLNLRWPGKLDNSWLLLFSFLLLGTFSTTIVSIPKVSGIMILFLILIATVLAMIYELRAFCRYLCPINAFIGHYARIGKLSLRAKDRKTCSSICNGKFCETGNTRGWACPYGLNVEKIEDNSKCGLCMECLNSCTYSNTGLGFKAFGTSPANLTISEAFLGIVMLVVAIVYNIFYHGPNSELREYINIVDKDNWDLFLIYSVVLWTVALLIVPAFFYGLAWISKKSGDFKDFSTTDLFKYIVNGIIPLGLMIWIAFIVPMVMINFTFILQSLSDPFGWGWNWFGFAGIPWRPILPEAIPWLQVLLVLAGILLSIKNLYISLKSRFTERETQKLVKIIGSGIVLIGLGMILFYSNY